MTESSIGVLVGAEAQGMSEAAGPLADAILKIITAEGADQETRRAALVAFSQSIKVENVSLNNCTVTGPRTVTVNAMEDA